MTTAGANDSVTAVDRLGRRPLWNYWPPVVVAIAAIAFEPMPLGIVLQGLVVGLVGALVAVGMALVYQSNRIINFAQADLGLAPAVLTVCAVVYAGVSWFVAVPAGLVVAGVLGALVDVVVVRRFRTSPRLILMVATIGLAQLLAAASLFIPGWWHKTPATLQLHVPLDVHFTVSPLVFSADHVMAAVVASALLVGLAAILRFTDLGLAIRAGADRSDRARLLGLPVDRLQTIVWAAAAALSFIGIVLRTGILGLGVGPTLSLNALLAALTALVLGGLDLGVVAAGAVSLGVLEAGLVWNHPRSPGVVAPVYAVVVVACLLLRRHSELMAAGRRHVASWRLADEARRIPAAVRTTVPVRAGAAALGVVVAAALVALPHVLGPGARAKAAAVVVFSIVTLSLVVLTGWSGQISLGQMSFAAIGAVAGAHASTAWHADMVVALAFAGLVGAAAAMVVGLPAVRFGGLTLAVTTLAFALTMSYLFVDKRLSWVPIGRVARPPLLGGHVLESQTSYYYLCLGVVALAALALSGIRRARTGRVLRAAREDSRVVEAYAVSVAQAKLTAFAISGVLAAVAGCLLVHLLQSFAAATYAPEQSLVVFTAAVVGGLGSMAGAVLGAVFLKGGEWLLPSARWQALTSAVGVLVVLWVLPGGLAALVYRIRDVWVRTLVRRRGTADSDHMVIDLREGVGNGTVSPPPRRGRGDALLSCRDLNVAYGPTRILFGIDFDVFEGDIVALVGTNGAGKSTLVRAICGLAPVVGGDIYFGGSRLSAKPAHDIARRGVSLLPGGDGVFPSLTVSENLRLASSVDRRSSAGTRAAHLEQVLVWFPVLRERLDAKAGDLSGGQQQMLALAMAFLGVPRLLILDELDLGLAPSVVALLVPIVRGLRDRGTTVIIVEQSLSVATQLAETAYFMEKGRMLFAGSTAGLLERPDLLRAVFLGGSADRFSGNRDRLPGATNVAALDVVGASVRFGGIRAVDDVSLRVDLAEVVGVIGPNGAGKSTLFDAVSGFVAPSGGRVSLVGADVSTLGPAARARAGLGRTFQEAHLFPALTVEETIAVAQERWVSVRDPVREALRLPSAFDAEAAVQQRTDELVALLNLEDYREVLVRELSTGTKRILEIACALAQRPSVLLLDEPSTGLAQREAEALQPLLVVVREQLGAAVVIIEHDTALLSAVADRIVAMDLGRVIADGRPADVLHDPIVLNAYLGTAVEKGDLSGVHG